MFRVSDYLFLTAAVASYVISAHFWFKGNTEAGIFTAIWVPTILIFGVYFKLTGLISYKLKERSEKDD